MIIASLPFAPSGPRLRGQGASRQDETCTPEKRGIRETPRGTDCLWRFGPGEPSSSRGMPHRRASRLPSSTGKPSSVPFPWCCRAHHCGLTRQAPGRAWRWRPRNTPTDGESGVSENSRARRLVRRRASVLRNSTSLGVGRCREIPQPRAFRHRRARAGRTCGSCCRASRDRSLARARLAKCSRLSAPESTRCTAARPPRATR